MQTFPVLITADSSDQSLASYFSDRKPIISAELAAHGAILFRGFNVSAATDFDAAVTAFGEENFPYKESLSNAVRVNVTERVFTANEAPPDVSIFLHHEMAQTPIYPSKLFFYCEIAADGGGATPVCRSDLLLDALSSHNAKVVQAFEEKGVRYRTTMPYEDDAASGLGRSWRSTLGAVAKKDAEKRLAKLGYEWTWLEGEALRVTTPRLEAVRVLPDGRKTFFNQLIAAYRGWKDARNDPSKSITFGDDTPIDPQDMAVAIDLSDELTADLQWQPGDVALLDNYLVMHGRRPFSGKRRVLASLIS